MTTALPKHARSGDDQARSHGAPSPVLAYALFVLGIAVLVLTGLSFVFSSHALMGAGVIIAVPFVAVLMLALLQYFDRRDR